VARHHKKIRKTNRGNYKKKFHPFPFCENEEIEVTIEGLTHLGHGVARLDHTAANGEKVNDWVVFIPFALPNEKVRAKVTHNGKSNSLAELCDILKPSSERVEPKCRHFFYCGGCHFQHLDYNAQLTYQTEQVTEQLKRLAGIEHPVKKPITTDKIWNYRSKLTPHLQQNKNDKNSLIGFHHHTNKEQIVGIQRCEIAMEPLNDVLQQLKKRPSLDDKSSTTLMRINGDKVETEATNAVSEKVGNITFHFLTGRGLTLISMVSKIPIFTLLVLRKFSLKQALRQLKQLL